jgi:hypothetical protein
MTKPRDAKREATAAAFVAQIAALRAIARRSSLRYHWKIRWATARRAWRNRPQERQEQERRMTQPADSLPVGALLDPFGDLIPDTAVAFSDDDERDDETVYQIFECIKPKGTTGEKLGLRFHLKPGWLLCTFKIAGGDANDSGLVFLRGTVPPPPGTRFAVRILRPVKEPVTAPVTEEAHHGEEAGTPQSAENAP